jgi:hypothetical protein
MFDAARTAPGILAIWNDCRAGREAEFEHWYQSEHLFERLAVPGFLLGRRYEAVKGAPRYFAHYVTQSPEVLTSEAYLARLNDPTAMTQRVMTEMFIEMTRTLCRRATRRGDIRGAFAVTARFDTAPADDKLAGALDRSMRESGVSCGEIWTALAAHETPVSREETLRGRDRRIAACLVIETLRQPEAENIAQELAQAFPDANVGAYRLLCEIGRSVS